MRIPVSFTHAATLTPDPERGPDRLALVLRGIDRSADQPVAAPLQRAVTQKPVKRKRLVPALPAWLKLPLRVRNACACAYLAAALHAEAHRRGLAQAIRGARGRSHRRRLRDAASWPDRQPRGDRLLAVTDRELGGARARLAVGQAGGDRHVERARPGSLRDATGTVIRVLASPRRERRRARATVTPGRFVAPTTENVVPAGSVPFRFASNGSCTVCPGLAVATLPSTPRSRVANCEVGDRQCGRRRVDTAGQRLPAVDVVPAADRAREASPEAGLLAKPTTGRIRNGPAKGPPSAGRGSSKSTVIWADCAARRRCRCYGRTGSRCSRPRRTSRRREPGAVAPPHSSRSA